MLMAAMALVAFGLKVVTRFQGFFDPCDHKAQAARREHPHQQMELLQPIYGGRSGVHGVSLGRLVQNVQPDWHPKVPL